MSEVGLYILTYPGDYHLSTALIRSLRYFDCEVPIMIIPGEGFDRDDHPFDVPVMAAPGGFWSRLGHVDRKFWAFQGPFEKFIYLDADVICTRSVAPFVGHVRAHTGRFVAAYLPISDDEWRLAVARPEHELHRMCVDRVSSQLGNVKLLAEFDPAYDPYGRYPFNAGVFASSRGTIEEEHFADLHARESAFFRSRLQSEFSWSSHRLFFADQGRLNYLVDRLGIDRFTSYPHGHYQWGGETKPLLLKDVLAGDAPCTFVHWAGTPRPTPSLFCRKPLLRVLTMAYPLAAGYGTLSEIPGYSVWRHFSGGEPGSQGTLRAVGERLRWTWRDLKVMPRRVAGRMRRFGRRRLGIA